MYEVIAKLQASKITKAIEVLNFVAEKDIQSIYVKTTLVDGTILWIRETITEKSDKYSYHWQDKQGKLLIRWDNSRHYSQLETFPHHKHVGAKDKVQPSKETNLDQILMIITKKIRK